MGQKERRERERQQRRSQILNAARALLLKEGFAGTSVNKISKKAELSIGSIYFYFKNKEEIFAALQSEGLEILYAYVVSETQNIEDPGMRLSKSAAAYLEFSQKHRDYFDIINYFISSARVFFSEDVKRRIDSKGAVILEYIADIIRDGVKKGVFKEDNPGSLAVFFWISVHGLVHIRKLQGVTMEHKDFDSFFRFSTDKLIDSIGRP
ncbi:MAG: TetR/AcrR family transcriptional regulator [Desulfobacterales bacterium]